MNKLRLNRRVFSLFLPLCLILTLMAPARTLAAPAWPSEIAIQAEGGILMDADSGCVIFGQNIHQQFFPASITKILTALIIVERCDLDDTITFSHNAVYNVERGSTSAGYDTGDQITVREALYAMLLKSANEVANALAEHVGAKHPERIFRNTFLKRRIKSDAVFHIASDNCRIFPEHALSRTGGINQDFIEIFRETVCKVSRILGQDQGVFHTEQL